MPQDDPHELFYLVNDQDEVLGAISRHDAHADPHKIHRAVYILATNQNNQMLLQKRTLTKDLYPGQWSLSCSGHVTFGLTYMQAAEKEVFEELGIHPHLFYVTNLMVSDSQETEHCQIYMCKIEQTPDRFDLQEIAEVKWVDIGDLQQFINQNPLPPTDIEVLRLLLYIK